MSYLLYGQNGLLLDERIAALRSVIDPQGLSTTAIDVQSSNVGEIAAACHAMPFFGGQRLVILRHPIQSQKRGEASDAGEASEDSGGRVRWADLHDVLKSTPSSTTIIMRHDGPLAQTHYLVKAVRKLEWETESHAPRFGHDLLAWIQQRVEQAGLRIEPRATERIAVLLYPTSWEGGRWVNETPDMRLIASEVDKLCCADNDGLITVETVDELVADRSGFTAFRLNDHLFGGRPEQALVELENVLSAGEPAERVLGQISSEAIALATVRHSNGIPRDALTAASGISANRIGGLQQKASGISDQGLNVLAELVRAADADVKTGQQTGTSATIIPLVADVAEVIRRGSRANARRN